jgi:hypothetical protein
MTTLCLMALIGMLALVFDIGWAYFQRKSAQKAADAASLAGAYQALFNVQGGTPQCGTNVPCQDSTPCPSNLTAPTTDPIAVACLYAQQNGFSVGGSNGRQVVSVAAGTTVPPPSAPGVTGIYYWMTVRVMQKDSIWFGAVLTSDASSSRSVIQDAPQSALAAFKGLPVALALTGFSPAARASAGVTDGPFGGSLFLLNRQNDTWSVDSPGVNLTNGGNPVINAPGGIYMASINNGSNNPAGAYAGRLQGTPVVTSPFTYIRGAGGVTLGGNASWTVTPTSGLPDSQMFWDPMSGKGQPPALPSGGLTNYVGVPNGCLSCMVQPLLPGQYYAIDSKGNPTGAELTGSGTVTFSDNGTGFGSYVLYGGLNFKNPGTTVTFSPGRYVLAGAQSGNQIFSYHSNVYLRDRSTAGVQNTDAGEIFIFTDPNYPGLAGNYPPALSSHTSTLNSFVMQSVYLQAGNTDAIEINLHGLNVTSPNVPSELKPFSPAVFWQDQRQSRVSYTSSGYIDKTSCGSGHDIDNPCTNSSMANSDVPGMNLQAHPNTNLYGLVYQPRGAWMTLQGNGNINSPTMFVTGAMNFQGGADLRMLDAREAVKKRLVVLIE